MKLAQPTLLTGLAVGESADDYESYADLLDRK